MDPALYTLIGALGGVIITQVANYYLEGKRTKAAESLKNIELDHRHNSEISNQKRQVFAKYLESVDRYCAGTVEGMHVIIDSYYNALIISNKDTGSAISELLEYAKLSHTEKFDNEEFRRIKSELMDLFRMEIS